MKNTKHTAGGWAVDEIDSSTIQIKASGVLVAEITSASTFTRLSEEQRANARLIAAAPELLEALKYARRFLKPANHDVEFVDGVIAKAEGEGA